MPEKMAALQFEHIDIGYKLKNGNKNVLQNLNISAEQGELIALIGVNGSGKSTLLRSVVGIREILSGKLIIDGKNISGYRKVDLAKKIAFVSSEIIRTKYLKVFDTVALGRFPYQNISNRHSEKDKKITEDALALVGMYAFKDKLINEISDGERQKVMTARALAQDTDIILLDEPTSFLDLENTFALYKILYETAHSRNKTVIFSTHDINIALKYCDKVWLIKDEKIIEGSPEDLIFAEAFQSMFSDNHIVFNQETFEFTVNIHQKFPVNLINRSKTTLLKKIVLNALNRRAFYVSEKPQEYSIEIVSANKFILKTEKENIETASIYELMKVLTKSLSRISRNQKGK